MNPRAPFEANGFQDRRFQPLTHPSSTTYGRSFIECNRNCRGLLSVLHPLKGQPNGFFAGLNVETWKLSTEKVWRIFHDEPGVLTLQNRGPFTSGAIAHCAFPNPYWKGSPDNSRPWLDKRRCLALGCIL